MSRGVGHMVGLLGLNAVKEKKRGLVPFSLLLLFDEVERGGLLATLVEREEG